jgi:hypothetical protein
MGGIEKIGAPFAWLDDEATPPQAGNDGQGRSGFAHSAGSAADEHAGH